jgi:ketosteroid isomerase-like protein
MALRLPPRARALSASLAAFLALSLACRPEIVHADPKTFSALEARLSDALAAYDRAVVDALWDDDLVFVSPDGKPSRKAERLAAQTPPASSGGPRLTASNDSVEVEYEDAHVAIVLVRSSWRFGDGPPDRFLATHVWIRRPRGWRLISAQVAEQKPRP